MAGFDEVAGKVGLSLGVMTFIVASALSFPFSGALVVGPFTAEGRAALGGVEVGVFGARLKNSVIGLP